MSSRRLPGLITRTEAVRRVLEFEAALARRAAELARTPVEAPAVDDDDIPERTGPRPNAMLGVLVCVLSLLAAWVALHA